MKNVFGGAAWWRATLVTAALVGCLSPSQADAATYLPSVKIGTAALISPAAANTYYGSNTASTDGLSALKGVETPTPPEIVELARALKNDPDQIYQYVENNIQTLWMYGLQKGALGTEIDRAGTSFDQAELMMALLRQAGFSANYVAGTILLNSTQFYNWTGITNARAACQLLSSGSIPATINGITNVACSSGFNAGGSVSTVQLAHIWIQVTIPNSHTAGCSSADVCVFDPSFKVYNWKQGIDLATAMQFTSGQAMSAALTGYQHGTTSGAPWVSTLNATALDGVLQGYASNLLNYIQTQGLQGYQMEDLIGGGVIVPVTAPVRQASLPYADPSPPYGIHTWTPSLTDTARYNAIPDQYRTKLQATLFVRHYTDSSHYSDNVQAFDASFFVDEIYGRRLSVGTDYNVVGINASGDPSAALLTNTLTLLFDGQPLQNVPAYTNAPEGDYSGTTRGLPGHIVLVASHPYAVSADGTPTTHGDYMDTTVDKWVVLLTPFSIVHGWGDVGPGMFAKWASEDREGTLMPRPIDAPPCGGDPHCISYVHETTGDFQRDKTNASWLVQYTRSAQIHAALAHAKQDLHHAIGIVYADTAPLLPVYYWGYNNPPDFRASDSFDRVDIDSGISVTSTTAQSNDRRAAIQAIAATAAALEGSVSSQLSDAPDTSSTATRFEWANAPPSDHSPFGQNPVGLGPQNFYQFTQSTASVANSIVRADGYLVNVGGATSCPNVDGIANWADPPEISQAECQRWGAGLAQEIIDYANAGFTVVAPQEAFLGPGQRASTIIGAAPNPYYHEPSKQRGGALVATLYDSNGDPAQIAHIQIGQTQLTDSGILVTKGGGGGVEPNEFSTYNPGEAADVLKSQLIDRSNALGVNLTNGSLSYTAPASLRVGNGGFPFELSSSFIWHPGPELLFPISPTVPRPGWAMSWANSTTLSGSGMEAMGQSDIRAAVGTIAAFVAAQDIYKTETTPAPQNETAAVLADAWWADQISGNVATVTVGNDSRQFVRLATGAWIMPGAAYATVVQNGNRTPYEYKCKIDSYAPYAYSRGWSADSVSFDVTNAGGDVEHFANWTNTYESDSKGSLCGQLKGFRLTNWTFPYGITVTVDYGNAYDPHDLLAPNIDRLVDVHNSLGRQIDFVYDSTEPWTLDTLTNNLTSDPRSVTMALDRSYILDAASKKTAFTYVTPVLARPVVSMFLGQVFTADNLSQANVEYDYDSLGRVNAVKDAVAIQQGTRNPYVFYLADGTRGERDDPLGQPYTVYYDSYGHPARYIDEVGNETDALFDSRGRAIRYIYPEGDCEVFGYDDHNNTIDRWRVDKTSSCNTAAGTTHVLHANASYNQTWNKPITVTDARRFTTQLTYYGSGAGKSLVDTVTRPSISEGQPVYAYTYTGIGKVDTVTDADNIVTKNAYDSGGTGNLISTTLDYNTGSGHLNLATLFAYDPQGDVISTTDPRGILTNSCYDLDRRKTEDDHHDGSAATLIAAEKTIYDSVGRDVEDDRAKTLTSAAACAGQNPSTGITWIAAKATQYTPTSKVHIVTDADGKKTTTSYDNDDRVATVSDPLSRKMHFAYCAPGNANCAANQVKTEYRGWVSGTGCSQAGTDQQCYRRVTFYPDGETRSIQDANGNITNYAYDDFIRLSKTTFPDSTYEQLTLDENGNVTARRNRAGETLTYQYNALNWITQKVSPNPAVTTNWTYTLDGHIDLLSDDAGNSIDYSYDTAGRVGDTYTTIPDFGAYRGMHYNLDRDGNHTELGWSSYDGSYDVGYCYDNLNRMVGVSELPTDHTCNTGVRLATYTYDALSRRTNLLYGNGASIASPPPNGYSDAGDLLLLNHDMAGTANDPHYTFTYTGAHELATEANTDADYAWQPSVALPTSYGAANNLNQYPSVTTNGGVQHLFGYDAKGNLTSDGAWSFGYDAENRLLTASKTGVSAAYDYDPLGRRNKKSGTGVTAGYYLNDGDDEVVEYDSGRNAIALYVPGPAIDEPVAMVKPNGSGGWTHEYFHWNHQGSVIAMSGDGTGGPLAEGPFTYGPYGDCFQGTTACAALASSEPFKFTGRRLDPETGLYYYRARYYAPGDLYGGRFLQTDPVGYTADLNLYTYVRNDPVSMTDPRGTCPWCWFGAFVGFTYQSYQEQRAGSFNRGWTSPQAKMAYARIAGSTALGAVGGEASTAIGKAIVGNALSQIGARIAANAAVGAGLGAASAAGNAATQGRAPTTDELQMGAAWGAVMGTAGTALGEGIAGVGRNVAGVQGAQAYDPAQAQVDMSEAPSGMNFGVQPPDLSNHPITRATSVLGNAAAGILGNAPEPNSSQNQNTHFCTGSRIGQDAQIPCSSF